MKYGKFRAIALIALLWAGFFGIAGVIIMNGGYYLTDSILGTRDFFLVAYQAFVRFGVLGGVLGVVFALGVIVSQMLAPASDLSARRAALLGALCGAIGGSAALASIFSTAFNWTLFGILGVLGAGLGSAVVHSARRNEIKSGDQLLLP